VELVIPDLDKPVDELITKAYKNCNITQGMMAALRDPQTQHWPKAIRKNL
jgi:hypothetical protein